jgi:multiple sugar transport system substrate-binding protein
MTGQTPLTFKTVGAGTVNPWRMFSTFYAQLGGQLLTPDNRRLALDDGKALTALTFMRQLTAEGLAVQKIDVSEAIALFSSGRTAFFFDGEWDVSTFRSVSGLPFSMAPIPALWGSVPIAQADCHSLVLPHESGRGGAPDEAAYTFAAYLLKNSLTWAEGGHIPAYTPVRDSAAYRALQPQSDYASLAEHVALDPKVWFAGSASTMWLDLGADFSNVLTGVSTPRAALAAARAQLQQLLDSRNPFGGGATA